jgi:hypothetical protein
MTASAVPFGLKAQGNVPTVVTICDEQRGLWLRGVLLSHPLVVLIPILLSGTVELVTVKLVRE